MLTRTEQLECAIAHSSGHLLLACPLVIPLPGQERMMRDAVDQAQAAGLVLPRRIVVGWRDRPRDSVITDGVTVYDAGTGETRIVLDANLFPDKLREVMFHELKHASDRTLNFRLTRLELEERALLFAAQMMGYRT